MDLASRADARDKITRSFQFTECEFRDDGPDGFVTFEGVASVVDKPYTVRDMFGTFQETIHAGAFDKTLKELKNRAKKAKRSPLDDDEARASEVDAPDAALYVNHDYRALPLATVSGGRLDFWTTPDLAVRAFLNPARPSVQEARHAVADGDAKQMSIGFSVPKDKRKDVWSEDYSRRSIFELSLGEGSIVWRGANHMTSGAVRSLDAMLDMITDGDYDEAEIRRCMVALQHLLPTIGEAAPAEVPAHVREQHESLSRLWDARRNPAA